MRVFNFNDQVEKVFFFLFTHRVWRPLMAAVTAMQVKRENILE